MANSKNGGIFNGEPLQSNNTWFPRRTRILKPCTGRSAGPALSAALAARLTEMVANLTVGREKFFESQEEMLEAINTARSLSDDFMGLAKSDAEAFNNFIKALSLTKGTDGERSMREEAMENALKRSALIPLEIIVLTRKLAAKSLSVALLGNPNAITDAAISALLAETAAKGATLNERINIASIKDAGFAHKCREQINDQLDDISKTVKQVHKIVDSKLDPS